MRGSPGLRHFEKAAKKDSQYIFEAAHFKKGIWTYVGRTQYATGRYAQARQSLGLALSTHEEDRLARLYLGLVLLRGGFELQGLAELRTGMQDLHDWIDYIVNSRVNEPYWDPNHQIRGELKKCIALIAEQSRDRAQLVASAEWIGQQVEQEIDRVRREESRNR